MRTIFKWASLGILVLWSTSLCAFTNPERAMRGYQDGSYFIKHESVYDKVGGKSTIKATFYTGDGSIARSLSFVISGIEVKNETVFPIYNPYNRSAVDRLLWKLNLKGAKQTKCVLTTSELVILKEWNETPEAVVMSPFAVLGPPEQSTFAKKHVTYLPIQHMVGGAYEKDAITVDGGTLYFNYDHTANYDPWGVGQRSAPSKSIQPTLYYYTPEDNGYEQKWGIACSEKWILNYRVFGFGDYAILYTSFLENGDKNESNICVSKLRLIDWRKGVVVYEGKVPSDPDAEFVLSEVTYDTLSGNIYFVGDMVQHIKEKKWSSYTSPLSKLVIGVVDATSKVSVVELDLGIIPSVEASKGVTSMPFVIVQDLRVLNGGEVVGAGVICYWQESKNRSSQQGDVATIQKAIISGVCSFKLKDLQKVYSITSNFPAEFRGEITFELFAGSIRNSHSKDLYERSAIQVGVAFDPASETFLLACMDGGSTVGSTHGVWAIKHSSGKIDFEPKKIGTCEVPDNQGIVAYPCILPLSTSKAWVRKKANMADEFVYVNL